MLTHLNFFTLSHTQPLYNFHLNIGYLIPEIQANLAQNKANTWLNKFNLTHTHTHTKQKQKQKKTKNPNAKHYQNQPNHKQKNI